MQAKKAIEYTRRLQHIRNFPREAFDPDGFSQVAEVIAECCSTDEQAEYVVSTLGRECQGWTGTALIWQMYAARFNPAMQDYSLPYKPPDDICQLCQSLGCVQVPLSGKWIRCTCEVGRTLDRRYLDFQNACTEAQRKRTQAAPKLTRKTPGITQADVERAVSERRKA